MYRYSPEDTNDMLVGAINWIKNTVNNIGANKVVLGISGGKDSTVAAMLCVEALGADKVFGVLLPNGEQKDIGDSLEVCDTIGIDYMTFDISGEYESDVRDYEDLRKAFGLEFNPEVLVNVAPRIRMKKIYEVAAALGGVVCGTGNLCEKTVGYTTKHGDNACDFNPLGNLLVSQVIAIGLKLADKFNMRESLILKTPSDGLGVLTDEQKLGVTYEQIENYIIEPNYLKAIDSEAYYKIDKLKQRSEHKRHMAPEYMPGNVKYHTWLEHI